jgi:predicted transcriptional regulator
MLCKQRILQQGEIKRNEQTCAATKKALDDIRVRVEKIEQRCEMVDHSTHRLANRLAELEKRAAEWDLVEERARSVQAEIIAELYTELKGEVTDKVTSIQAQLRKQESDLHEVQQLSTPRGSGRKLPSIPNLAASPLMFNSS